MTKRYFDTAEEAGRIGLAVKTLQNWRVRGDGPPYFKVGSGRNARVLYDPEQTDAWLASHLVRSTSEAGAA